MAVNLLFVSSYSGLGGGETALLSLVTHLDGTRFCPHLLVPCEGDLADAWRARGWPVHVHRWRGASVYFIPPIWARLPISRKIEAIIHEHDICIVHAEYHALPMALPAAERAGAIPIWTCMGWWFHPKPWQHGFFRRAKHTFAHSQAIKRGFLGEPPFMPLDSVEVLYPGVNTERFRPGRDAAYVRAACGIPDDVPLIVMVARFQNVKGHDTFQRMAKIVATEVPTAWFLVVGENTQTRADDAYKRRILDEATTDPILRDKLVYAGFRADVPLVLNAADVVVCASHFEGFGMVNVEAMACGVAVVSTNNGGPAETIIDGETGFLVPPQNPIALAEQVIALLKDDDQRAKLGDAGRVRAKRVFAAQAVAHRFADVMEMLLQV